MATEGVTYRAETRYSRAGFWLTLIGASIIIIQGLMAIFFSSIVYAVAISLGVGIAVLFLGIILLILGLILYSSAYAITRSPGQHVAVGATIIVLSFFALFFGGGYIIGSVCGIIGGLLVLIT